MPHIQIDINKTLNVADKKNLAREVNAVFAEVMATGTDHISLSLREFDTWNLSLGRVSNPEAGVALVNADIRAGRSLQQRRSLALGIINVLNRLLGIPPSHMYVTLTEHPGEDFHLYERYLASWQPGENPLHD
jgi:phenylpyruvate tautomerase PptA (4-oxalocrotonate tautomerase family)